MIQILGAQQQDSSVFYLTKYLGWILCSFLLLLMIRYYNTKVHLYDEILGLMGFLSLHVDSINIKGNLLVNFLINVIISSPTYVLLFIIILHISGIECAFWRYRNKSRSRATLLQQFSFFSLKLLTNVLRCL